MRYFNDNALLRWLRFFNLLEPEENIISISKIFMWIMLIILVYVMMYMPENMGVVLSAVGANFMTTLNYAYRRWMQFRYEKTDKIIPDVNLGGGIYAPYGDVSMSSPYDTPNLEVDVVLDSDKYPVDNPDA